ncbi:MAG: 50S ribosomal protein L10 [bacterium]|nr:50S ribosomal protein L10 [bacterium]
MASKEILDSKKQQVEEIGTIFQKNGVYLFDYRGLTVPEMEDLRNRVKKLGANVTVIKNRLAIKYFEREKKDFGRDLFKGPMAAAYADENFVEVAKTMVEFAKEKDKVELKAGFIEQTFADAKKVKEVAKLPGKDQLLAQLAFSISMPLKKMGMALSAPLRNTLILMNNLKDKKEKEEK